MPPAAPVPFGGDQAELLVEPQRRDCGGEWKHFRDINTEFFDGIGTPGGSARLGLIPKDHPTVAALPPQAAD
ncbi:MAG: hypothetical protein ACT4QG_19255 [Sporichthyaceae bacterium]